jgi:hypothetical protein
VAIFWLVLCYAVVVRFIPAELPPLAKDGPQQEFIGDFVDNCVKGAPLSYREEVKVSAHAS